MNARNVSDDALQDSVASLRMADGFLRDLADAGAIGPADLAHDEDLDDMFDLVCDAIARDSLTGVAEVLRLTEQRLEDLAVLVGHRVSSAGKMD